MHSWGRAHECSGEPGGAWGGRCEAPRGRHVKALPLHLAGKDGNWHWRSSGSSSRLGPGGAIMEDSPGFTVSLSCPCSTTLIDESCTSVHTSELPPRQSFAEAYLKHLSLRSSSFPALKCWFVLSLCQSVQALAYNVFFLGPPCIQREPSHRQAGGMHRQDFQRM